MLRRSTSKKYNQLSTSEALKTAKERFKDHLKRYTTDRAQVDILHNPIKDVVYMDDIKLCAISGQVFDSAIHTTKIYCNFLECHLDWTSVPRFEQRGG